MVVRTSRSDGNKFLGCSKFPACKTTGKYTPVIAVVDISKVDDNIKAPPMIPARAIDCANPALAVVPEGTTSLKVQKCFELLLRLVLCEGCQDHKVSQIKERLSCSFDQATIESLRKASKHFTKDKLP